jgi:isopentenyl diphosphate isomerase/L-lactate dehydrogenase-like FMN-dependent dehydrogenase
MTIAPNGILARLTGLRDAAQHTLVEEGTSAMLSGTRNHRIVLTRVTGSIYSHFITKQLLFKLSKESIQDLHSKGIMLGGLKAGQVEYIPILD